MAPINPDRRFSAPTFGTPGTTGTDIRKRGQQRASAIGGFFGNLFQRPEGGAPTRPQTQPRPSFQTTQVGGFTVPKLDVPLPGDPSFNTPFTAPSFSPQAGGQSLQSIVGGIPQTNRSAIPGTGGGPVAPTVAPTAPGVSPQQPSTQPQLPLATDQVFASIAETDPEAARLAQEALAGGAPQQPPQPDVGPTGMTDAQKEQLPPETQKAVSDAEAALMKAAQISDEEITTQADLDKLISSTREAFLNTQEQPVALDFITGQLQSIENRALGLAEPLEKKLSRLQAKRQASIDASEFALERADKAAEIAQRQPEGFTLGKDQVRFDAQGNVVARGATTGLGVQDDSGAAAAWADLVETGKAKLENVPSDQRTATAITLANRGAGGVEQKDLNKLRDAGIVLDKTEDALEQLGFFSTGVVGQLSSWVRATPAGTLDSIYKTIQAKIGFAELQAMRDASPTGGALGQVSERELDLLSSTIANLDVGLSANVQANNLEEIVDFFQKFQNDQILKFIEKNPDATDEEISALLGGQSPASFSGVGGDTNQASGNRPQRNNNPGNIKAGGLADSLAIGQDDQGHLIFPDAQTGFQALQQDLQAKIAGQSRFVKPNPTIAELGKVYAEDPNWPKAVARLLGVSPSTPTNQVDFNELLKAVATQEGFFA